MTKPVRLQLSRKRGFNLQELSRATNGLEAVSVVRPHSTFQNRWKIGTHSNRLGRAVETTAEAVECFRLTSGWATEAHMIGYVRERLAGKNLACWCQPGLRCHADVLLELANPSLPEGDGS
jgi:hypothetical protein